MDDKRKRHTIKGKRGAYREIKALQGQTEGSYVRRTAATTAASIREEAYMPQVEVGDNFSSFTYGRWFVLVELGDVDGRVEPIRLEIRGFASVDDPEAAPITAVAVREMPVGAFVKAARESHRALVLMSRESLERRRYPEPEWHDQALWTADQHVAAATQIRGRGGRHPVDIAEVQKAADAYREAYNDGDETPTKTVAKKFGWTYAKAANRVRRARQLGILGPTKKGVPGV